MASAGPGPFPAWVSVVGALLSTTAEKRLPPPRASVYSLLYNALDAMPLMSSVLRKPRLSEQAYEAVRELLREGKLRSGEPVSELRLAETLGMSRTPVREAVRRLLAENLLEDGAGMGVRVPLPTPDDFAEVYYTRAALEAEVARIATSIANATFVSTLDSHFERMQAAVASQDTQAVLATNGAFHGTIVAFAGNKRIGALLQGFEPIMTRYRMFSLAIPEHLQRSVDDHRQLIDLIANGDADTAADFSRRHIMRAGGRVVSLLRGLEGIQTPPSATARLLLREAGAL
jgi:DNA-binding GntR family transcriptional regulator